MCLQKKRYRMKIFYMFSIIASSYPLSVPNRVWLSDDCTKIKPRNICTKLKYVLYLVYLQQHVNKTKSFVVDFGFYSMP